MKLNPLPVQPRWVGQMKTWSSLESAYQLNIDQTISLSAAYNAKPLFKSTLYGTTFVCMYMPWPDVLAKSHLWGTSHPLSLAVFCFHKKRKVRRERHEKGKHRRDSGKQRTKENMTEYAA